MRAARAVVGLDVGELTGAEGDFEAALEMMDELHADRLLQTSAGFYVQTLARRGSIARAENLLAAYGLGGAIPEQMLFNPALFCRGELRLAQRRFDAAEADFGEHRRRHDVGAAGVSSGPGRVARARMPRATAGSAWSSGARPRRRAISGIDALTPSEPRVASLAAQGQNQPGHRPGPARDHRHHETHLTRAYRKLDIDGRDALAVAPRQRSRGRG